MLFEGLAATGVEFGFGGKGHAGAVSQPPNTRIVVSGLVFYFQVWDFSFMKLNRGFEVWGSGFEVLGLGFWVG